MTRHKLASTLRSRAEAALLHTLADVDSYRDRAMWRRNVLIDVRRLRVARAAWYVEWGAYVASRTGAVQRAAE